MPRQSGMEDSYGTKRKLKWSGLCRGSLVHIGASSTPAGAGAGIDDVAGVFIVPGRGRMLSTPDRTVSLGAHSANGV